MSASPKLYFIIPGLDTPALFFYCWLGFLIWFRSSTGMIRDKMISTIERKKFRCYVKIDRNLRELYKRLVEPHTAFIAHIQACGYIPALGFNNTRAFYCASASTVLQTLQ